MRNLRNELVVAAGVLVLGGVIGCGGQGTNGFSSSTSTSGSYTGMPPQSNAMQGANKPGEPATTIPGNEILYAEYGDDGTTLERLSVDGKHAQALTKLPGGSPIYAQDPSATHVAFVVQKETGLGIAVNTTTSPEGATLLAPATYSSFGSVQFAPSGEGVLFTAESAASPSAVYFAATTGKMNKKLDDGDDATISPNGKFVAYSKTVSGHNSIFVIGIDGKGSHAITTGKSDDLLPQWSKNGKEIFFTSNRDGNFAVYGVTEKGGTPRKIAFSNGVTYGGTSSPDGKRIAFSRVGKSPEETGLFVANANGSQPKKISDTPAATGNMYWTTPAVAPGKSSEHAGAPALSISPRAKGLLKLPDAPVIKKIEPKKDEKATTPTDKPVDSKAIPSVAKGN